MPDISQNLSPLSSSQVKNPKLIFLFCKTVKETYLQILWGAEVINTILTVREYSTNVNMILLWRLISCLKVKIKDGLLKDILRTKRRLSHSDKPLTQTEAKGHGKS